MRRLLFILLSTPLFSLAQNKSLLVEGVSPNLFISHTVAPKENYYSIGRLYNVSPKEIAPFNKLALEKGLSLNQVIKIPLLVTNFLQVGEAADDEATIPVYHTAKDKENLLKISANYNKLPINTLKQWNNIKGESVANGTKLIVGYLKVKKDLSALAGTAKPVSAIVTDENTKEITNKKITAKEAGKPDISNEPLPVVKKIDPKKTAGIKPSKEKVQPIVEEIEKAKDVKEISKETATPVETKKAVVVPAKSVEIKKQNKNFNGGFFKTDFDNQLAKAKSKEETGTAGIFKSTSGWEDGKYYCLHNSAQPGTILKISSKTSGKIVYAKVLDVIPDISQNEGLLLRLSNAAAAELGETSAKFDCEISFAK